MLRLTIKNLLANKTRFALTTFGVILAVSFVVSAFVLGDGLRSSFTKVSEDVTAGVDLQVRSHADFGDAPPLAADTVSAVAAVPGVAAAVANIESADSAVRPVRPNGENILTNGPPILAFNWIDDPQLSPFTLVDGAPPQVGQFTMDVDSATKYGFVIGDTYHLNVPHGRVDLTMSGTSKFGPDNSTLGAVLMQMNTDEASELFGIDGITNVAVQVTDGANPSDVEKAIAAAVPSAEVVDHATVLAEKTSTFTDGINLVGNILLGFGLVAVFVSIFIIYNTFAIVMSQRSRELALLRTVGAGPRQIRRSVLGEALVIGVIASVGGIAGGIAVAKGIALLFSAIGVHLSAYPLILAPRTLIVATAIGVGVTLIAAIGPSRRASTVSPIAVLNGSADIGAVGSRTRKLTGVALFVTGLGAAAVGLAGIGSTSVTVATLGFGVIAIFLGVTVLSPLAVGVVTRVFGWPMRKTAGVAGRLAQTNAARNPRRTATTAAALMIGLALVTTALIVGQSVKATIGSAFEQSSKSDYYVSDDLDDVDFPATLAGEIRTFDVVAAATGFTPVKARVDGSVTDVVGFDFDQIERLLELDITSGGFDRDVTDPVVVSADKADAINASVGDTLPIDFANGSQVEATIVGVFDNQSILPQDYLLDTSVLTDAGVTPAAAWLGIAVVDNASPTTVQALVGGISDQFPFASVETPAQFRERNVGKVDQILAMANVMVALAIIIALIGIANTLALSVFERTRELGLARAVGMSRRQLRRMVRYEAALVATFGATLGVGLGLLFGSGVVSALPASFATGLEIPVVPILVLMLVAAGAGVVAAWLPARRAGRLDVLDAIAL